MGIIRCCYQCKDRNAECHAYCERYHTEKHLDQMETQNIKNIKNKENDAISATVSGYISMKRGKRGKRK